MANSIATDKVLTARPTRSQEIGVKTSPSPSEPLRGDSVRSDQDLQVARGRQRLSSETRPGDASRLTDPQAAIQQARDIANAMRSEAAVALKAHGGMDQVRFEAATVRPPA